MKEEVLMQEGQPVDNQETKLSKGTMLEVGKRYTINNFKPEELEVMIVPRNPNIDVLAVANEILTIGKYAKDQKTFSEMVLQVLNTNFTGNIGLPKVEIIDTTDEVTEETKA